MNPDFKLRDYQAQHAAFHLSKRASLNYSACATGKTATMAFLAEYYWKQEACKTVVINPISLSVKNKDEFVRFTDFDENEVAIVKGTPKQREKIYANRNVKVFIIGFDTFGREWEKFPEDVKSILVDESHLGYSGHKSARTQAFYRAQKNADHITFFTATPVGHGALSNSYPLFAICDSKRYGTYDRFMRYHAIYNSLGYIVGWRGAKELGEGLRRFGIGINFEDAYKDSQPNIVSIERCEIEDEAQKKAYEEMEESGLAELEDRYLEAKLPGVNAIRCRQFLECPEVLGLIPSVYGKDELLKTHLQRIVDGAEKSILVFSCFVAEQERVLKICEEMGIRAELINGSVSGIKRGEISKRFMSGETQVLVASEAVLSGGANFEQVDETVFLSLDYSSGSFSQALFRGNRGTRKKPLPVTILQYKTRIEDRVWKVVQDKTKTWNDAKKNLL